MKTCDEVDRLTLREYEWLMEAEQLHQEDLNHAAHRQAFLNFAVQATDKKGRPRYKTFDSFYTREEENKTDRFSGLKNYLKGKQNG